MSDLLSFHSSRQLWYVYILKLSNGTLYKGYTQDIENRLIRHQSGQVVYTKKHLPVELVFYAVFYDKYKALDFEKYLKSGSGRAFMIKHLL